MLITLTALALVASPVAAPQNTLKPQAAECQGRVEQAMAQAGAVWKQDQKNGPGVTREWQPDRYPEAGYYRTLNKLVDGCAVPVPIYLTNASTPPKVTKAKPKK